jgi:hypothetical protein
MKTQQRPFVVEVKSRRRSIVKPKSIWGDANLQALAKAVEEDVPHLFRPAEQHPLTAQLGRVVQAEASADLKRPVIVAREFHDASCREAGQAEVDRKIAPSSDLERKEHTLISTPKKKERVRRQPGAHLISADPIEIGWQSSEIAALEEDLAKLIDENDQLKRMLRARLNEENDRLREMIARYAS